MSSDDRHTSVLRAVNPISAKIYLDSGYAFLDVRTVEEFNKVRVAAKKFVNIPYMLDGPNGRVKNDRFLEEVSAVFKKDDCLLVGDQNGRYDGRALHASQDLRNDDFKHGLILGGGIEGWLENDLPWFWPREYTDNPKAVEL